MAFSSVRQHKQFIPGHGGGHYLCSGVAVFSTTDASGDIEGQGKFIRDFVAFPLAAVATDESLYLSGASVVDGFIVRPASGLLTVARTGAAKTNNLPIAFQYRTDA